mgnify:FL=1
MNISFYTLGCKLNYAETSTLREQFEKAGHSIVEFGEPTDAVIINTCTVTENADSECRKIIRRTLRTSPNAFVGVTGCYAQLQPEEIASIDGVDAVFGSKEKFAIPLLFNEFHKLDTPQIHVSDIEHVEFVESSSSDNDSRNRAFLKLQDGCNYNCSFCTIPLARGGSRSMKFTDIMPRINTLIQAGFREIVLSGINLGDYTAPTGEKFVDVLRLINSCSPEARFRISSIEPNLLTSEIIDLVASSEVIVPHFHIPLQSGSPDILKKMRRRYKAEYYSSLVTEIKSKIPDCCIGVDVIVGFPGETDTHFEETFSFLHELPISYLHVFTYSERENTPAAEYLPKVQPNVRKERTSRLRTLSAMKKHEFYRSQIGTVHTIIPEFYYPETKLWIAWTENYVRVEFSASPSLLQIPMQIQLDEIKGEVMTGTLLESPQLVSQNTPEYYSILF